ncbi:MAG: sulfatase, partial [Pirellulales bacterium]|nr:sulfatase [Pirellulales bacterium]
MKRLLVLLLALLGCGCCARAGADSPPNILWINAEDMSPHLGCYGHPDAITPHIDRLATEGIVYRNAFATAPICSPARSCLATGLYATSLGTQHLRCEVEIPPSVVPLAVRLRKLGYYCTNTGKSDYNFAPEGIWDAWNNDAAPWQGRRKGQPFFAFITVGETHEGRINFSPRYAEATKDLPARLKHQPDQVEIPPFYPDTPEIRAIFAGMHDLATVFDRKVGAIVDRLKSDGDFENTILFIFGDHGNGLPRYKRWLNDSGLRVPLVVYLPPKYQHFSPHRPGARTDELVSFVDFPATALRLAGGDIPDLLQGKPFLGPGVSSSRQFVFGARSRADDMFEVSRSVFDGRFFYVRHFLPHLPYIQDSVIFGDRKSSFRELRRLHQAGQLNRHAARLWAKQKPREELYDLHEDPHELNNLADSPAHRLIKAKLADELRRWIVEHRDSGFLPEAEYQIRAARAGVTPFEIVQDGTSFDLQATLSAAWKVGDANLSIDDTLAGLRHGEAGVRYWSAIACRASQSRRSD